MVKKIRNQGYPQPPPHPHPTPHPHRVDFVVEHCVALLKGLPSKRDRNIALGQITATLTHGGNINGVMDVVSEHTNAVNHYTAAIE